MKQKPRTRESGKAFTQWRFNALFLRTVCNIFVCNKKKLLVKWKIDISQLSDSEFDWKLIAGNCIARAFDSLKNLYGAL